MSVQFVNATPDYLQVDSAPVTAAPFSTLMWFYPDNASTSQSPLFIGDKDVTNQMWVIRFRATGGSPSTVRFIANAGSVAQATSGAAWSTGAWNCVLAVEAAADDRRVYLNGANKGTNATLKTPAGADRLTTGRRGDSSPSEPCDGRIGEIAIWNIALDDDDAASLYVAALQGLSPELVKPHGLVFYLPLWNTSELLDRYGGLTLGSNGSPASAEHPAMIYRPSPRTLLIPTSAAAHVIPKIGAPRLASKVAGGLVI